MALQTSVDVLVSPQLGGGAAGLHEEPKSGSFLPGETDDPEPLVAPGDVPAQACAEDPQIPSATTGDAATTVFKAA